MDTPQSQEKIVEKSSSVKSYKQRYRKEWEETPAFRGWLACVPENPCLALCRICKVTFTAKLSDIRSHSNSNRHQQGLKGHLTPSVMKKRASGVHFKTTGLFTLDVSNIVALYKEHARIPEPVTAYAHYAQNGTGINVTTRWKMRDTEQGHIVEFTRQHVGFMDTTGPVAFHQIGNPQDCTSERLYSLSHTGNKRCVIRRTFVKNEEKQFIEIWNRNTKFDCLQVDNMDAHGKVYEKGIFASLDWSLNENKVVYIAERFQPKRESFFSRKSGQDIQRGTQFLYEEDWGEQYEGQKDPVIAMLNVHTATVQVVKQMPDCVAPGQAIWAPNDHGLVFVGWDTQPFKLGIAACRNRRSRLYYYDFASNSFTCISEEDKCIWSPRFSPDRSSLVYLQSEVGGPHQQGSKIMRCNWEKRELICVVDTIQSPRGNDFPGLYVQNLVANCWCSDNATIVVSSQWHSKSELLGINTINGSLIKLSRDETVGHWEVLCVKENIVVAALSSLNSVPQVVVGVMTPEGGINYWSTIDSDEAKMTGVCWYILQFAPPDESNQIFEATLVSPKGEKDLPLIVWPHGGPHSAFHAGFQLWPLLFVKLGFAVLLVNYRGSLGFGEDTLRSLPGKVGSQDVFDVQCAAEVTAQRDEINPAKVLLFGGSHGGFIAAHAIGQFPDFYRACVVRNPVTDLSMMGPSDIPDWYWYEAGCTPDYQPSTVPEPKDLDIMWGKSPFKHIKNVRAPTLFLLGKNDQRVDKYHGLKFHKALKGLGVTSQVYMYDDNHSLGNVNSEADCFVNTVLWFKRHLKAPLPQSSPLAVQPTMPVQNDQEHEQLVAM